MVNEAVNTTSHMAKGAIEAGEGIFGDIMSALGAIIEWATPFISAILILIIGGWIISFVMKYLKKGLEKAKVDAAMEKIGLTGQLSEMGVNVTASALITGVITLVSKVVLYMAAINVLGINQLSALMNKIVEFLITDGLIALILVFAGLAVAKFVKELVEKSASSLSLTEAGAKTAGKAAKIVILVFTGMAVMTQLDIAANLIDTLFTGIVTALTLAGGIAFGLGGQEKAKEFIANITK